MDSVSCFHLSLLGLLVTNFFLQGTDASACPTGWLRYQANCFGIFSGKLPWKYADEECKSYGRQGRLASILSKQEGDIISSHILINFDNDDASGIWIGLRDPRKKGYWKWADLSTVNYLPWSKQQNVPEPSTPSAGGCVYLSPAADTGSVSGPGPGNPSGEVLNSTISPRKNPVVQSRLLIASAGASLPARKMRLAIESRFNNCRAKESSMVPEGSRVCKMEYCTMFTKDEVHVQDEIHLKAAIQLGLQGTLGTRN